MEIRNVDCFKCFLEMNKFCEECLLTQHSSQHESPTRDVKVICDHEKDNHEPEIREITQGTQKILFCCYPHVNEYWLAKFGKTW